MVSTLKCWRSICRGWSEAHCACKRVLKARKFGHGRVSGQHIFAIAFAEIAEEHPAVDAVAIRPCMTSIGGLRIDDRVPVRKLRSWKRSRLQTGDECWRIAWVEREFTRRCIVVEVVAGTDVAHRRRQDVRQPASIKQVVMTRFGQRGVFALYRIGQYVACAERRCTYENQSTNQTPQDCAFASPVVDGNASEEAPAGSAVGPITGSATGSA